SIGIEVAVNDGDLNAGGWAPTRLGWADGSGTAYENPSVMGELLLGVSPLSAFPIIGLVNAAPSGSGYVSEWFGYFETPVIDWIKHGEFGWLFTGWVESTDSMVFYSYNLNTWLWTSQDIFGYFYDYAAQTWITFIVLPEEGVFRYDFSTGIWVKVP
ncbi:MAG: hypothetical protein AB3N64_13750, partial [Puniceicoccaceae bacterium]